jgi:DNA polymerase-3 subunit gamma/tau
MAETEKKQEYRVLARKYRPQNFSELIGQDALVRTLTNAIESGRVAHAFMLTGVRGVGKTTTARIIAKALNYRGADGKAGPTIGDTSDCSLCKAISEDRHPDVMEMDAASRTGVDDIREILDGVRYAPSEARYKVYIIDEVHMLSKNAFNALLKTLEEPPEHVKFIFATTEIRKVPITVLSRCQRFDLKRVDVATLSAHFSSICGKENVTVEDAALQMIARASDGSVRDGLSILDQAISMSGEGITAVQVQDMLGLADRAMMLDLLDHLFGGRVKEALAVTDQLHAAGADPVVVLQDLLDFVHVLTRFRSVPDLVKDGSNAYGPDVSARLLDMASRLSMPSLNKGWQILLKGLDDVRYAPDPRAALDMVAMRMMYASDLPDPRDLIKKIEAGGGAVLSNNSQLSTGKSGGDAGSPARAGARDFDLPPSGGGGGGSHTLNQRASSLAVVPKSVAMPVTAIKNLEDVKMLAEQAGELILASEIYSHVELIKLKEGVLEIAVREDAMAQRIKGLQKMLCEQTGQRWMVSFVPSVGKLTLAELAKAERQAMFDNVLALPVMQDVMRVFPEARLIDIIEENE